MIYLVCHMFLISFFNLNAKLAVPLGLVCSLSRGIRCTAKESTIGCNHPCPLTFSKSLTPCHEPCAIRECVCVYVPFSLFTLPQLLSQNNLSTRVLSGFAKSRHFARNLNFVELC